MLFDVDADGYISFAEMQSYIRSVFKVLFETMPETRAKVGMGADKLAALTAHQAFTELGLGEDGLISLQEFTNWYASAGILGSGDIDGGVPKLPASTEQPTLPPRDPTSRDLTSACSMLNLDRFTLSEILETLGEVAPQGIVNGNQFVHVCRQMIQLGGNLVGDEERDDTMILAQRIFDAVAECTDEAAFADLAAALAALRIGGPERLMPVFLLFGDDQGMCGIESLVRYLTAVNRCLIVCSPRLVRAGYGPAVLARTVAARAWTAFDLRFEDDISAAQWELYIKQNPACAVDL